MQRRQTAAVDRQQQLVDGFVFGARRPYRTGMPKEAAIVELRQCADTQFDPDLVETFISIIQSGDGMGSRLNASGINDEVMLNIGEQVERLVEAAERG